MVELDSLVFIWWTILKLLLLTAAILLVLFTLVALFRAFLTLFKKVDQPIPKAPLQRPKAPQGMKSTPKAPPSIFDQKTKH